jgi:hypothetical protein
MPLAERKHQAAERQQSPRRRVTGTCGYSRLHLQSLDIVQVALRIQLESAGLPPVQVCPPKPLLKVMFHLLA